MQAPGTQRCTGASHPGRPGLGGVRRGDGRAPRGGRAGLADPTRGAGSPRTSRPWAPCRPATAASRISYDGPLLAPRSKNSDRAPSRGWFGWSTARARRCPARRLHHRGRPGAADGERRCGKRPRHRGTLPPGWSASCSTGSARLAPPSAAPPSNAQHLAMRRNGRSGAPTCNSSVHGHLPREYRCNVRDEGAFLMLSADDLAGALVMSFELGVYTFGNTPRTATAATAPPRRRSATRSKRCGSPRRSGSTSSASASTTPRSMPLSSPTVAGQRRRRVDAADQAGHDRLGAVHRRSRSGCSSSSPPRRDRARARRRRRRPRLLGDHVPALRLSTSATTTCCTAPSSSCCSRSTATSASRGAARTGADRSRTRSSCPRPEQPLRIWLGTGGSPESVLRAVELGLPMFLGILGGTPEHWAQYGRAYREAWAQAGHPAEDGRIAVAVPRRSRSGSPQPPASSPTPRRRCWPPAGSRHQKPRQAAAAAGAAGRRPRPPASHRLTPRTSLLAQPDSLTHQKEPP